MQTQKAHSLLTPAAVNEYLVLATDYDHTLATEGQLSASTVSALRKLRSSNRSIVLITGRQIEELKIVCPDLSLFNLIVAENGAVLFHPTQNRLTLLASPFPEKIIQSLKERAVTPLQIGQVILSTFVEEKGKVIEVFEQYDFLSQAQLIPNRESLMILPAKIDKKSGLKHALEYLKVPSSKVIGVGDAENDIAFLAECGLSVAVANAIDSVKKISSYVTTQERGEGVVELIAKFF
jgi:hydroxymethylpyrimidine pyrophosphatase-like HAD family hydrolase